jgi:SAM-dependent methyltransferase
MNKIEFKGEVYPDFQASGFAARFAFPFAEEVCKGNGLDVGCMKSEWKYGNSFPIDISFDDPWDALELPEPTHGWDYIFSSHCLEHLPNWVSALDYWHTRLRVGGVVFLYLPDHSQKYWRSWHNRKHIHNLTPEIVGNYFKDQPEMWTDVMVSNVDLNNSFIVIAYKK